jgi:hypothetical protein
VGLVAGGIGVALVPRSLSIAGRRNAVFLNVTGASAPIKYELAAAYCRPSPLLDAFLSTASRQGKTGSERRTVKVTRLTPERTSATEFFRRPQAHPANIASTWRVVDDHQTLQGVRRRRSANRNLPGGHVFHSWFSYPPPAATQRTKTATRYRPPWCCSRSSRGIQLHVVEQILVLNGVSSY